MKNDLPVLNDVIAVLGRYRRQAVDAFAVLPGRKLVLQLTFFLRSRAGRLRPEAMERVDEGLKVILALE